MSAILQFVLLPMVMALVMLQFCAAFPAFRLMRRLYSKRENPEGAPPGELFDKITSGGMVYEAVLPMIEKSRRAGYGGEFKWKSKRS